MKTNMHIEIVSSTAPGLSSMSQKSRDAIRIVLAEHYTHVRITIVNNLSDLKALVARGPDLVFSGMKFIPTNPDLGINDTNKIWIAKYLDAHGIVYTGSNYRAHELELNKPLAKQQALDNGIQTSPFCVMKRNQTYARSAMPLSFPLFIKPTNRGGGLGIDSASVAHNFDQLESKVQAIAVNHQADSLVEEYLSGREFSVAILKQKYSNEFLIMPIEKIAPEDENGVRLLSQEIKSADAECDAEVTDKDIRAKITSLAMHVFHALGARDYGRIDIRLDAYGRPHFLEANLVPSLISGYGSFPRACVMNADMDYETMILTIVDLALVRNTPLPVISQADLPEDPMDAIFTPILEPHLVS